jgi:hypothetical protein
MSNRAVAVAHDGGVNTEAGAFGMRLEANSNIPARRTKGTADE